MILKVFDNIDSYTMMSLCDVIYHACNCLGDKAVEFAEAVAPSLIKCFNVTNEEQSNSIFSLVGKRPYNLISSWVECLCVVISVLKSRVEKFA